MLRSEKTLQSLYLKISRTGTPFSFWALHLRSRFPTPKVLAQATEEELFACNLGYRSKYVIRTAQSVESGQMDLDAVSKMPYKEARIELLKCYGIGVKVADCICLFGMHKLEAFPVDTHIRQALDAHYPAGFPFERYAQVQGVIQQYIFYWELKKD